MLFRLLLGARYKVCILAPALFPTQNDTGRNLVAQDEIVPTHPQLKTNAAVLARGAPKGKGIL